MEVLPTRCQLLFTFLLIAGSLAQYDEEFGSGEIDDEDMVTQIQYKVGPGSFILDEENSTEVDVFSKMLNRTNILIPQTTLIEESNEVPILLTPNEPTKSFLTFADEVSFAHFQLKQFSVCSGYQIKFNLRADTPNGLLLFLDQGTLDHNRVHHYIFLKHGRLAVKVVIGDKRTMAISDAGGLQDRESHSISLFVSCYEGRVIMVIDGVKQIFNYRSLEGIRSSYHTANLWIGGVNPNSKSRPLHHAVQFRGCLSDILLIPHEETKVEALLVQETNVRGGAICTDHCTEHNPCSDGVRCINHFSHATCDCYKTGNHGKHCEKEEKSILSFNGDGHLSHKLYEWKHRADKTIFRASFMFKTKTPDAILMYIRNLYPHENSLSLIIDAEGRLRLGGTFTQLVESFHVELDGIEQNIALLLAESQLEDLVEEKNSEDVSNISPKVTDDYWHSLTLTYEPKQLLSLGVDPDLYFGYFPEIDQVCHQPLVVGDSKCSQNVTFRGPAVYFDSRKGSCTEMIGYSGCGGNDNKFYSFGECMDRCVIEELRAYKPFVGCMKKMYVNEENIMDTLTDGRELTAYTGELKDASTTCDLVEQNSILSLTTEISEAVLPSTVILPSHGFKLELMLKLKNNSAEGVIAHGRVEIEQTITNWILYHKDEHIHFKLENNVLNFKASRPVESNGWNEIKLETNKMFITLMLNDHSDKAVSEFPLSYLSGISLGSKKLAMIGCAKSVRVDGILQDLRQFVNVEKGLTFDRCKIQSPCELNPCFNGGKCSMATSGEPLCDCSGTEYEGNKCQFAKYLRSCLEYRRHGFNVSDYFLVDLDGPGGLPAVSVMCSFNEEETITELDHNIPDNFVVRKKGFKDHTVLVNYHNLPNDLLVAVLNSSDSCRQDISFECIKAKLRLSSLTWFSSPRMSYNSHFGPEDEAICPCRDSLNCVKSNIVCNCDANDPIKRVDSATITNKNYLPITSLHLRMSKHMTKKSKSTVSLGKLTCTESVNILNSISLLDSKSFIEVPVKHQGNDIFSLGFAFRTSASNALILYKPSFHYSKPDFRLVLQTPTRLNFQFTSRLFNESVNFHTNYMLNTAAWQNVWMDVSRTEIRITLNGHKNFMKIMNVNKRDFMGEFYMGGTPRDLHEALYPSPTEPGLIGCLKDLYLNDIQQSLPELIETSPSLSYRIGCSLSCDPNPCRNGAQCIEKSLGDFECICSNPFAHSGKTCQHNLNHNAVTFLGTDTDLVYSHVGNTDDANMSPLSEDIKFAFKTREVEAQLFFALDNLQNLIQISLSMTNEITLIWNTRYNLRTLRLGTGKIKLNRGQLVQISLERQISTTVLKVLVNGKNFENREDVGVDLIDRLDYQQYPFGSDIPHPELTNYPKSISAPEQFLKVFLAGAHSKSIRSKLPGLRGCLSGLKVGETPISLDDRKTWTWNTLDLEIGCHSLCHESSCRNEGVCQDVFQGSREVTCDCSRTSYNGRICDREISYSFDGNEALSVHSRFPAFSSFSLTIEFSFAISAVTDETQTLMVLRNINVEHNSETKFLGVALSRDKKILIYQQNHHSVLYTGDLSDVDITDGYRYFVEVITKYEGAQLMINKKTVSLSSTTASNTLISSKSVSLSIAGHENIGDGNVYWNRWSNFTGCISNVRLLTSDKKTFEPLKRYSQDVEDMTSYNRTGLPGRTTCSAFKVVTTKVVSHNLEAYQDYRRMQHERNPEKQMMPKAEEIQEPEAKGSTLKTIGTLSAIYMAVVCVGLFLYLRKISKNTKPDQTLEHIPQNITKAALPTIVEETTSSSTRTANEEPEASEQSNLVSIEMQPLAEEKKSQNTVTFISETDQKSGKENDPAEEKRTSLDQITEDIVKPKSDTVDTEITDTPTISISKASSNSESGKEEDITNQTDDQPEKDIHKPTSESDTAKDEDIRDKPDEDQSDDNSQVTVTIKPDLSEQTPEKDFVMVAKGLQNLEPEDIQDTKDKKENADDSSSAGSSASKSSQKEEEVVPSQSKQKKRKSKKK